MGRRTIRRYAHELYPHAAEYETRPLSVEVPYLYARFVGASVQGTDWFDLPRQYDKGSDEQKNAYRLTSDRTMMFLDCARIALLADALQQGLTGDEAWAWAHERVTDDMEVAWERAAEILGDDLDRIKPYTVVAERTEHDHVGPPDANGWRSSKRVAGRESECPDCTEDDGLIDPIPGQLAIDEEVAG